MRTSKWQWQRLGEICVKIGSGATPRGGEAVYTQEGTPLIRSQNVYNGHFASDGLAFIGEEASYKLRGATVLAKDVLLNITGDSVARSCVVPDSLVPARVNQHVAIIRPKERILNSKFLGYFLITPYMQKVMLSWAGTGGTRKAITKTGIEGFEVPVPPTLIQESVVSILSTYDDLIENNRRRITLLEEAARLLYREWFVHFRFPGHERAKFVDGLPEGWKRRTLRETAETVKVTVKPTELTDSDAYIGLEHIPRRSFTLSDWTTTAGLASNKQRFEGGDILFGKIRPYFHKVGFTLCDGVTSSDAIVWRVRNADDWPLFVCATSSDHFVAVASKTVREGSKMPRADEKVLLKYLIPRPSTEVLTMFNDIVLPITSECKVLAQQNQKLAQARDLLLPRLMSGEIAV